ncbi:MAG TPA: hypothetical protein VIK28_07330 [Sedimentisphaerales bacterium]
MIKKSVFRLFYGKKKTPMNGVLRVTERLGQLVSRRLAQSVLPGSVGPVGQALVELELLQVEPESAAQVEARIEPPVVALAEQDVERVEPLAAGPIEQDVAPVELRVEALAVQDAGPVEPPGRVVQDAERVAVLAALPDEPPGRDVPEPERHERQERAPEAERPVRRIFYVFSS